MNIGPLRLSPRRDAQIDASRRPSDSYGRYNANEEPLPRHITVTTAFYEFPRIKKKRTKFRHSLVALYPFLSRYRLRGPVSPASPDFFVYWIERVSALVFDTMREGFDVLLLRDSFVGNSGVVFHRRREFFIDLY